MFSRRIFQCIIRRQTDISSLSHISKKFVSPLRWGGLRNAGLSTLIHRTLSTQVPIITQGRENTFAYSILKKPDRKYLIDENKFSILKKIRSLSEVEEDSEAKKQLLDEFNSTIKKYENSELVAFLDVIENFRENSVFQTLIKILDLEGSKRVPNADPVVILTGAIKIYEMGLHYKSEWIWSCLKRFCRRLDLISKPEMLKVMFLVNIVRQFPMQYSGFNIQYNLVKHFEDLTLDEMALVGVAFFKSKTKLNNKVIMSTIMRKLVEEVDNCQNLTLAMLCKIIRYSLPVTLADELYVLQERLVDVAGRLESRSLTHVVLTGTNVLLCHEKLIRTAIYRLRDDMTNVRLKDMERMLLVMSLFDLRDDIFIDLVIRELRSREEEIVKFPKAFVSLVHYITILQRFELDLIDRVLSQTFIKETYDKSFRKIGIELISIDKSVEIERPEYSGSRLDNAMLKTSAKVMTFKQQASVTGTDRFSYALEDVLKTMYGDKNVTFITLLPHHHFPDFVLGFDDNLSPISPPDQWKIHRWAETKQPPDLCNTWLVLIIGGWNTLIRNTGTPLGSMKAKMRQLRMLGYHPILTSNFNWRKSTDKVDYLKQLIDPELKKIMSQRTARRTN